MLWNGEHQKYKAIKPQGMRKLEEKFKAEPLDIAAIRLAAMSHVLKYSYANAAEEKSNPESFKAIDELVANADNTLDVIQNQRLKIKRARTTEQGKVIAEWTENIDDLLKQSLYVPYVDFKLTSHGKLLKNLRRQAIVHSVQPGVAKFLADFPLEPFFFALDMFLVYEQFNEHEHRDDLIEAGANLINHLGELPDAINSGQLAEWCSGLGEYGKGMVDALAHFPDLLFDIAIFDESAPGVEGAENAFANVQHMMSI